MKNTEQKKTKTIIYPTFNQKDRLAVWKKSIGMWKNRKPDPIKELKQIRKGWDRKLDW